MDDEGSFRGVTLIYFPLFGSTYYNVIPTEAGIYNFLLFEPKSKKKISI